MIDVTPELLGKMPLPDPGEGDKRARGNVLVVGGAMSVPGAVLWQVQEHYALEPGVSRSRPA